MRADQLEKIEKQIKERYQDTKEDHTLCGKYSKLLQIAKEVVAEAGEEILVKRLRISGRELTHSVLWNEDSNLEVLFLVTEGDTFLGCASWKIPVEDRNQKEIYLWEKHGDSESRWLRQEYLQEVFFG